MAARDPDVVSMTHMFGTVEGGSADPRADGGSNVGRLTLLSDRLEPSNFMPRFLEIGMTVRLLGAGSI